MKFCHWLHSDGKSCKKLTFHRHSSGEKLFITSTHQTWWAAVNSSEHQCPPFSFLWKTPNPTISVVTSVAARKERSHRTIWASIMHEMPWTCHTLHSKCSHIHTEVGFVHNKNWGFLFLKKCLFLSLCCNFVNFLYLQCAFYSNFWTKWKLDIQKQARQIPYCSLPQILLGSA